MNRTLVVIFFISCFVSCKKDTDVRTSGNMQANVDGAPWTATRSTAAYRAAGLLTITGVNVDGQLLSIKLIDSGVHRYTLSTTSANVATWIDSTQTDLTPYKSNNGPVGGEVEVTSIDVSKSTVSGTFSFSAMRNSDNGQRTFTEGSFSNIGYISSAPPAQSTDTLTVEINNASWTPASITTGISNGQLLITSEKNNGSEALGLSFPTNAGPGTYDIDPQGNYVAAFNADNDPTHATVGVSGTINILENSASARRVRGTFEFLSQSQSGSFSLTLTDGYFSVSY